MPNHITNVVTFEGDAEAVAKIKAAIQGDSFEDGTPRHMDFNKIIPRPEALNITSGNGAFVAREAANVLQGRAANVFGLSASINPFILKGEHWADFMTAMQNIKDHGHPTWYEWSNENWGTKWNAYSQRSEGDALRFDTAWSYPRPVFLALSKQHPDVSIFVEYADEDTGANCGQVLFQRGEIVTQHVPQNGSKEAYELSFKVNPDSSRYYRLVNGKYEFFDADDEAA